jgi:hypothetical protein
MNCRGSGRRSHTQKKLLPSAMSSYVSEQIANSRIIDSRVRERVAPQPGRSKTTTSPEVDGSAAASLAQGPGSPMIRRLG